MAKIDYEFDQGDGRPNKAGMRLRLAAIFIVVAALTCAIIYFLIPKSDGLFSDSEIGRDAGGTSGPAAGGKHDPPRR